MGKIIVLGATKGGTSKTSSTYNLAYSLMKLGKKVLAVDFDSQANLTTCFGVEDPAAVPVTIGDLMMERMEERELPDASEYIMERNGVDFIPSSMVLSAVDSKLRLELGAEKMLAGILDPLREVYDCILVDTCPAVGALTINALAAADEVIITVNPQLLAMMGLEELAISFGELLLPAVTSIVKALQGVVNFLNGLPEPIKKVIVVIALVAAALGPVLIVIGKVVSAIGTIMTLAPKIAAAINTAKTAFAAFNAVLAANPIMLVIMAITALVAAFIYLWNTNEKFRQFWIDLWESIKEIASAAAKAIGEFLKSAWEGMKNVASAVWNGIKSLFSTIWNGIKSTVTTVMGGVTSAVSSGWNTAKSTTSIIVSGIASTAKSGFTTMVSGIKSACSGIYSAVSSGFSSAVSYIKGLASSAFSWGADIIRGIVNGIRSCIGSIASAASSVASTIRSYLHFSVSDVGPLTDFESWMPDFMEGLAKGIEKSKGMVKDAVSGLAADMVVNPQVKMDQMAVAGGASVNNSDLTSLVSMISDAVGGATQSSGDIVIPVYLGGTMLDEVIVNAQQRANLRSGGR